MVDKQKFFVPIRIMITRSWDISNSAPYYTKDGEPCYSMRYRDTGQSTEVTNELYCELLNVRDLDSARTFAIEHPDLRFLYYDRPSANNYPLSEYETMEQYCKAAIESIEFHTHIKDFIQANEKYEKNPTPELRDEMYNAYRCVFPYLNRRSWESFDELEKYIQDWCSDVAEDDEESDSPSPQTESPVDLEYTSSLFDGIPVPIPPQTSAEKMMVSFMKNDIDAILTKMLSETSISYDMSDMAMICHCSTLLEAMYAWIYVIIHNQYNYAKCIECNRYYIVNPPPHEQKRCPIHMKKYQTRRKNQEEYDRMGHPWH